MMVLVVLAFCDAPLSAEGALWSVLGMPLYVGNVGCSLGTRYQVITGSSQSTDYAGHQ